VTWRGTAAAGSDVYTHLDSDTVKCRRRATGAIVDLCMSCGEHVVPSLETLVTQTAALYEANELTGVERAQLMEAAALVANHLGTFDAHTAFLSRVVQNEVVQWNRSASTITTPEHLLTALSVLNGAVFVAPEQAEVW